MALRDQRHSPQHGLDRGQLEHRLFGYSHHTASPTDLETDIDNGDVALGLDDPFLLQQGPPGLSEPTEHHDAVAQFHRAIEEAAPIELVLPFNPSVVMVNDKAYIPFVEQEKDNSPFAGISADQPDYLTRILQGMFTARKIAATRQDFYRTVAAQLLRDTDALYLVFDVSHWPLRAPASSALAITTLFEKGQDEPTEAFFQEARRDNYFVVRQGDKMDVITPYTGQELAVLQHRLGSDANQRGQYKHLFSYQPNGSKYTIGCIGIHGIPAEKKLGSHTLTTVMLGLEAFLHEDLQRLDR